MQWSQIDWKKGRWVITGKVMKNTLEADIPLTDTVIAILRDIQNESWDDKYVFPGLKSGPLLEQHHVETAENRHEAQRDGA
jgi:integrase